MQESHFTILQKEKTHFTISRNEKNAFQRKKRFHENLDMFWFLYKIQ